MFVKMNIQVLKLKFHTCNFKQDFCPLHKLYIAYIWQHKNTFIQADLSVPGYQTCICKRGTFANSTHGQQEIFNY